MSTKRTIAYNENTLAGRSTSGMKEPKIDTFTDVDRALSECLRRIDPEFARASDRTREMNLARMEKRNL